MVILVPCPEDRMERDQTRTVVKGGGRTDTFVLQFTRTRTLRVAKRRSGEVCRRRHLRHRRCRGLGMYHMRKSKNDTTKLSIWHMCIPKKKRGAASLTTAETGGVRCVIPSPSARALLGWYSFGSPGRHPSTHCRLPGGRGSGFVFRSWLLLLLVNKVRCTERRKAGKN